MNFQVCIVLALCACAFADQEVDRKTDKRNLFGLGYGYNGLHSPVAAHGLHAPLPYAPALHTPYAPALHSPYVRPYAAPYVAPYAAPYATPYAAPLARAIPAPYAASYGAPLAVAASPYGLGYSGIGYSGLGYSGYGY